LKRTKHLSFWVSVEEPKDKYQPKQVFWNVSGMKSTKDIKRVISYEEIQETIKGLVEIYGKEKVERELGVKIK